MVPTRFRVALLLAAIPQHPTLCGGSGASSTLECAFDRELPTNVQVMGLTQVSLKPCLTVQPVRGSRIIRA